MLILNSPQVVQETSLRWKRENDIRIAFVPTMGCLHEGHLELVKTAKDYGQKVIVSIFVNPLQFGPNEDFEKYPRAFEEDVEKLESLGVDLLFHPTPKELYPEGFSTTLNVGSISERLCGKFRPGHFNGVATVCLKLFQITQADFAVFGEKDFQQLRVIQQMTADLNLPISIVPHETVRTLEGVALSSRNRYLSSEETSWAEKIPRALKTMKQEVIANPSITVSEVLAIATCEISSAPLKIQYVEITNGRDLAVAPREEKIANLSHPHFFAAVFAGSRLIDNISLNGDNT